MTKQRVCANDAGMPAGDLDLTAADELVAARDLLMLVELGCRGLRDEDGRALNAGCYAALERLERAQEALRGLRQGVAA